MKPTPKYEGIQALRFVAALLVVVTHSTFYAHERLDAAVTVWKGGTVGVDIFFVISGFVMMITSHAFQLRGGWRNFAVRRVVRIVPMYWIATTVKLATIIALPGAVLHSVISPWSGVASYLFLPTRNLDGEVAPLLGVGWTLTYEMAFYAVFTIGLLLRRNVLVFASAVIIVLAGLGAVRGSRNWPIWAYYFDPIILYFVIGMAVGRLATSSNSRRNLLIALGVSLVAALAIAVLWGGIDWTRAAPFRKAIVAALFVGVVLAEPLLQRLLPKAVLFAGDTSYSLYLFHSMLAPIVPVALGIIGFRSGVLSIAGSISCSIIAGGFIYWFVERPITRKLRALPYAGVPGRPLRQRKLSPKHAPSRALGRVSQSLAESEGRSTEGLARRRRRS